MFALKINLNYVVGGLYLTMEYMQKVNLRYMFKYRRKTSSGRIININTEFIIDISLIAHLCGA